MENEELFQEVLHFMGDFRKTVHRGFAQAISGAPKCHFGMLERLHFAILHDGRDGAVCVSQLTRSSRAAPPSVSRDLRILEQEGLIERTADPEDRRRTLVRLTPAGQEARRACEETMDRYLMGVLSRLQETDVRRVLSDLRLVQEAICAETEALRSGAGNGGEET
jgi:DNA-binding MarR family transcriptional regulator